MEAEGLLAEDANLTNTAGAPAAPFARGTRAPTGQFHASLRKTLFMRRHGELGAAADGVGPALHDRLLLGIEAHPLLAVGVGVAEQRALPAAEAVPGHGHWDRHVDAHHAHLDAAAELTGHAAALGEAAHAVAEFVVVDQLDGGGDVGDPNADQHRAEDLLLVDGHLRGDMVEQGAAHPEALGAALTGACRIEVAAVHHQFGTLGNAFLDIAGDALVSLGGDDGAHLGVELHAVLDLEGAGPLGQARYHLVGHVAHQDRNAYRHAALAG